jgi:putative Mg2+ transporter-C (MgtC) family protein
MNIFEIVFQIFLATLMAGVIGYEREHKNRPAGIKTHILVCLGAASFAMTERLLVAELGEMAIQNSDSVGLFTFNMGRLVAQVISGIGFLGAGTIIITRHNIMGLTTAASVWIVACLGIIIGYGLFQLAIPLFAAILMTLVIYKRFLRMETVKKLEIRYYHRLETKQFIAEYFREKDITIKVLDFKLEVTENGNLYTEIYTIDLHYQMKIPQIIHDISVYGNIIHIRCITL